MQLHGCACKVNGCTAHATWALRQGPGPAMHSMHCRPPAGDASTGSSSSHPPAWHHALDAAVASSAGALRTYRPFCEQFNSSGSNMSAAAHIPSSNSDSNAGGCHGETMAGPPASCSPAGLCFLHPPNQPLKESCWGLSLVKSALRSGCWPHEQPGQVSRLSSSFFTHQGGSTANAAAHRS